MNEEAESIVLKITQQKNKKKCPTIKLLTLFSQKKNHTYIFFFFFSVLTFFWRPNEKEKNKERLEKKRKILQGQIFYGSRKWKGSSENSCLEGIKKKKTAAYPRIHEVYKKKG